MSTPETGRRYWARQLIDQTTTRPIPSYGSLEWLMADSQTKVASCVVAAEVTAEDAESLEANLRLEVTAMRQSFKAGEDADYRQRAQEHRAKYGNQPRRKPFLERRKAQLAATQPRPGDHAGGPVSWNNGGGAS